ncbi:thioredoxin fold domain-containing protein [Sulfurimonas sp. SAG-AH-194-C21]|nr:thioredoxin fold domain-containing protein [Sulfurimonas sp. SAG-AH-194-C21]MDF1883480.1 thioredoxin fold domain-containing protein [Sulfurimonas sp. SAG-AH-194-C21]
MKTIFLLLFIFISSLCAKVEWNDMFDVFDDAQASNKIVMVMLSREGCPGCEYMHNVVFEDKQVNQLLNDGFLAVDLDVNQDFVPQNLDYFASPTFYFLDKNEKILKRLNGGLHTKDFLQILKEIKKNKEEE